MAIKDDTLLKAITDRANWFDHQAAMHKWLTRLLWLLTALLSMAVALSANIPFAFGLVTSTSVTAVLAIVLPVVTGYTVLRSPENLWVFEVDMRNRLLDLRQQLCFVAERDPDFDREPYEAAYLAIMAEANRRWREIKNKQQGV